MNVDVYADIACPWCRLETHRFHRTAAEVGAAVTLSLRPFQLDPDADEQGRPLMDVMTEIFDDRAQVTGMVAEMTERGSSEGLEFRFDLALHVKTFTAHRLLAWTLRKHGPQTQSALATRLFDLYFRDGGNVADHAQLSGAADMPEIDRGAVRQLLASGDGADEVRRRTGAGADQPARPLHLAGGDDA